MIIDLSPQTEIYIQQIAQTQGINTEKYASQFLEKNLPKQIERPFDFDLELIKTSIESGFKPIPKFENTNDLVDWRGGKNKLI
ncbi:hypothetical protein [Moraxella boevrei]|uniref:hypothetical protein n=1 Tax=Faucicola boevrei TaxID=346665 RepID=UPI003736A13C